MGTGGYRIYHHGGHWFTIYHYCDGYPEGLGKYIWEKIPVGVDDETFNRWLEEQRSHWDEILRELRRLIFLTNKYHLLNNDQERTGTGQKKKNQSGESQRKGSQTRKRKNMKSKSPLKDPRLA